MAPERLEELRRIAQMARKVMISVQKGHDCSVEEANAVALYINTFDPLTVLDLLDEIEWLRREREEIVDSETRFELYNPDLNWWECQAADCRFWWEFEVGDPYEHDMRFCPRCGRRIVR